MKGPRSYFQIIGLVDDATVVGPKAIQTEDEILEIHRQSIEQEALGPQPRRERIEASKIIQKVSRKGNGISMGCGDADHPGIRQSFLSSALSIT